MKSKKKAFEEDSRVPRGEGKHAEFMYFGRISEKQLWCRPGGAQEGI